VLNSVNVTGMVDRSGHYAGR